MQPTPSFKSFYPRWLGWNLLGLGMTAAILSVIEFSGLLSRGLYSLVQSAPLLVLVYLVIALLTAACIAATQQQLMAPYLTRSLTLWVAATAVTLGVVLPNASDYLFALAAAAVVQWLVLRREFPRASRWLLWSLLPAELLAIASTFAKQYLLNLLLGDYLNGMSSTRLLVVLMIYNLVSVLIVTLISGVGMYMLLRSKPAQAEAPARKERNELWLLWVLAPVVVNFLLTLLSATGLFSALQTSLTFNTGNFPNIKQAFFALFISLAQFFVLRRYFQRAGWWVLVTLLGYLVGGYLYNTLGSGLLENFLGTFLPATLVSFAAGIGLAMLQALIVGLAQVLVLSRWAPARRTWLWPLILVLAELIGPLAPFPMVRELIAGAGLLWITDSAARIGQVVAVDAQAGPPAVENDL